MAIGLIFKDQRSEKKGKKKKYKRVGIFFVGCVQSRYDTKLEKGKTRKRKK